MQVFFPSKAKPLSCFQLTAGLLVVLIATSSLSRVSTPYMAVATLAYFFLVCGLFSRAYRQQHAVFMGVAIGIDLGIVLALELQRDAVATAMGMKLGIFQQLHIACSLLAVLFYIPVVLAGISRWQGKKWGQAWHKPLGIAAFVFRSLGFLFMFSLLWKN